MPYTPTVYVNGTTPAINATDLNKLKNELASQATTQGVTNTLASFTWANGIAPAVSDSVQLNEMERVAAAVAASLLLSYTATSWSTGWTPPRNATNLNKLENAAQANRFKIENPNPPVGTPLQHFTDFENLQWGGPAPGYILENRCDPGNGGSNTYVNQGTPQAGGGVGPCPTPWAIADAGVFEVSTPYGPGFKFVTYPNMIQTSNGGMMALMQDSDHYTAVGQTEDWSGHFMLPAAGNPGGFPAVGAGWNSIWEWHSSILPSDTAFGVQMGINSENPPNWRIYHRCYNEPNPNSFNAPYYATVPLAFDTWYKWRWLVKWAPNLGGICQTWINDVPVLNLTNVSTMPPGDSPYLEFGMYTRADHRQECWHGGLVYNRVA